MAFDEVKATQAAAYFLRLAGKPIDYLALIKLLYKADREALKTIGLPITTDNYVSMKLGPVTSKIYNLIKASGDANAHPSFWATHIQKSPEPYSVSLQLDPGDSELSPAEEQILNDIFITDGHKDGFTLAEESHRHFPEWQDPGSTSYPLEIADIVSALGLSEAEAAHIESLIEAQKAAFKLAV